MTIDTMTTTHAAFSRTVTHDADPLCVVEDGDLTSSIRGDVTCAACISRHTGSHNCGFRTTSRIGMHDGSTMVACPCGRRWTER